MAYQSFPWQSGDSRSADKLRALLLPDLSGLKVLDIGCNAGFFCGYAAWQGAAEVVGVDKNAEFVSMAREIFPKCKFLCQDWMSLGDEKFDVILFLSAIHYAPDQQAMLDYLMERVSRHGMLVLEIGIAPGDGDEFVEFQSAVGKRCFPTREKLKTMFGKYSVKQIGRSVMQMGDPVPRHVYHISHRRPLAILLMDVSHTGKSAIASEVFRKDLQVISGDVLYYEVMLGKREASPEIRALLSQFWDGEHINCGQATYHICKNGLVSFLGDLVLDAAKGEDFVLDMFVYPSCRQALLEYFDSKSYFVCELSLYDAKARRGKSQNRAASLCDEYINYLSHDFLIDEKAYLAANPDVAAAVKSGRCPDAQTHYFFYGRKEGRPLKPGDKGSPEK